MFDRSSTSLQSARGAAVPSIGVNYLQLHEASLGGAVPPASSSSAPIHLHGRAAATAISGAVEAAGGGSRCT
jgi:hypothetical protein